MQTLAVSLLVCALVALTAAAAVPEAKLTEGPASEVGIRVKRASDCPGGWTNFNKRCFLFVPTQMTWANAEKHCMYLGGHLASVHSFDEQHMIQSMILRSTHHYPLAWLGASDSEQEGTWFWSDGAEFKYTYWSPGQPDNHANADCLAMNFGGQKKFDDQTCYNKLAFVCAKKQ